MTNLSASAAAATGRQKPKHPHEKLRIHHGAVDQTTITTRPPVEVMKHVKEILEGMGMEMVVESEFKYRCVRVKRRKGVLVSASPRVDGVGVGAGADEGVTDVAVVTMVGTAASNGVSFGSGGWVC
jgi:protein-serine/threonine kinase